MWNTIYQLGCTPWKSLKKLMSSHSLLYTICCVSNSIHCKLKLYIMYHISYIIYYALNIKYCIKLNHTYCTWNIMYAILIHLALCRIDYMLYVILYIKHYTLHIIYQMLYIISFILYKINYIYIYHILLYPIYILWILYYLLCKYSVLYIVY